YLGADPAVLDPLAVDGTRTLMHSEVPDPLPAPGTTEARAVYDTPKTLHWGSHIAAYMVTKAIAAGALLGAALGLAPVALGWVSLVFTVITVLLLIGDLKRPERFLYLITMPNTKSWLVRGGWILTAHGALSLPFAFGFGHKALALPSVLVAFATAVYTAFLFRQARGRELWCEDRLLPLVLGVQAGAAMSALGWFFGEWSMIWMAAYFAVTFLTVFVPLPTAGARQAHALMLKHPAFGFGLALAFVAIFFPPAVFLAFICLDWIYIKAGQEVPLS
ncbi:MAG: polysulfide reductase NrfD, partial [Planctomycetota bacterium]|nr:polysulfide reductase NrfD [Planctomycetota bacterium]